MKIKQLLNNFLGDFIKLNKQLSGRPKNPIVYKKKVYQGFKVHYQIFVVENTKSLFSKLVFFTLTLTHFIQTLRNSYNYDNGCP